jgi:SAM-dependent methyltransferase
MTDPSPATQLALLFLQPRTDPTTSSPSLIAQMQHRLNLVSFWGIPPGSRVLELGCGQGDTTVALAQAVGANGHIDAVDPGSPDYGTPPLKEAHAHILSSPLGPRITFHHATATSYLSSYTGAGYDYIVLAHCIWYFENPSILPSLVKALLGNPRLRGAKLCLAEWALESKNLEGVPHVLTALLRALIEAKRSVPSGANIRTVLSPVQIKGIISSTSASGDGDGDGDGKRFALLKEEILEDSAAGMMDAEWEVGYTLRKRGVDTKRLEDWGVSLAERTQVDAYFDMLEKMTDSVGGVKGMACMSVWAAVFGR